MKIAVIGGGASGMMAAIAAAEEGATVYLYERNDRVGKKLLATGNGKCNFSNLMLTEDCYYGGDSKKRQDILNRFGPNQAVAFFKKAGMMVKDKGGYLYPASEQAATVLDIFRLQLREKGVQVFTGQDVTSVEQKKGRAGFFVHTNLKTDSFDKVILACGSKAAPKTGSDGSGYRLAKALGHSVIPVVSALVQLRCREEGLKAVAGVRQDAEVTLFLDGTEAGRERGEVQLTEYGISGIVTFQLSRLAAYGILQKKRVTVRVNFLPDYSEEDYKVFIKNRMKFQSGNRSMEEFFTGMLNKKLMLYFLKQAGLKAEQPVSSEKKEKMEKVFALCRQFSLTVTDTNSFEQAQVCAGGVPLCEVSSALESFVVKDLYLTGELLDVDGKCGGYNLQWAWASGYVAGKHAAGRAGEMYD